VSGDPVSDGARQTLHNIGTKCLFGTSRISCYSPRFPDTIFFASPDTPNTIPIYSSDMPTSTHFTGPEVAAMLAASAVLSHPEDGGMQVEKSGVNRHISISEQQQK
jgi:hypothetical protein